MGRMYRVTFTAKGSDADVEAALFKFLREFSTEHVLIESLVSVVAGG